MLLWAILTGKLAPELHESFQTIIMKPHRIVVYRYRKNELNFGVDPIRNDQTAAIFNLI